MTSSHAGNEAARAEQAIEWLNAGEDLALVSDAGTPLLSDPGSVLVRRVLEAGHRVVPVPGPSALLAALVGAGLDASRFCFLGFLSRKGSDRARALREIAESGYTSVVYEAPPRLVRTLEELAEACGAERRAAVGRELTKLHEEFVRGTLEEVLAYYQEHPARGEIVIVVEGSPAGPEPAPDERAAHALARALGEHGLRPSAVAKELVRHLGVPRNLAYEIAHSAGGEGGEQET